MQKKFSKLIIVFLLLMTVIAPITVNAKNTYFNTENIKIVDIKMAGDIYERCSKQKVCQSSEYLLGNVECECSTAWLLQKLLNYIRALAPTIVIVLSSIDFTKAVISSDDDTMKKTQQKLIKRLILVVVLFFIPTFVSIILDLFGIAGSATGGLV